MIVGANPTESHPVVGARIKAAVRRGVLLRPLGDVIVLMPPLTVTSEEVHRIVRTLDAALDEVCGP